MTLDEVIAGFNALSPDDQQRFRQRTKRPRGRPPKPLHEKLERSLPLIQQPKGKQAAAIREHARKEGVTAEAVERRLDRDLAYWEKIEGFSKKNDTK